MPIEAGTAAGIAAGGNIFSQILGGIAQQQANKRNWKQALKMYEIQRMDSLKDWAMQNEYNSPREQMKRFREAGINPAAIYGQTNMAEPVRTTKGETPDARAFLPDLSGVGQAAMGIYDLKLKDAQKDNLLEATKNAKLSGLNIASDTVLKNMEAVKKGVDTDQAKQNLKLSQSLFNSQVEAARLENEKKAADITFTLDQNERAAIQNTQSLKESVARILNMRTQNAKTEQERKNLQESQKILQQDVIIKQLDARLAAKGIRPGDPLYYRAVSSVLDKLSGGVGRYQRGPKARYNPAESNPLNLILDFLRD